MLPQFFFEVVIHSQLVITDGNVCFVSRFSSNRFGRAGNQAWRFKKNYFWMLERKNAKMFGQKIKFSSQQVLSKPCTFCVTCLQREATIMMPFLDGRSHSSVLGDGTCLWLRCGSSNTVRWLNKVYLPESRLKDLKAWKEKFNHFIFSYMSKYCKRRTVKVWANCYAK